MAINKQQVDPLVLEEAKKYYSPQAIRERSNFRSKEKAAMAHDPYQVGITEGVNLAPNRDNGLNFERYYGKDAYTKLGFNPYIDNETYYQQNTSAWDDIKDATTQWGNLFGLGFSTLWTGKSDREEARDYERYSNIGSTNRGGVLGTVTNAYLNSGYTIGLLSEIAAEELALGALSLVSGGTATPVLAARTAANVGRLGKLGQVGSKITSTVDRIKDLKNIGKAKTFFEGAKTVGQAINPLRGTTEYLSTLGRQYTRSKDTGKIVQLSDIAKWQKGFGTFYRDIREINLAMDEAKLESGFVSNKVKDELVNKYIEDHGEHPTSEAMLQINKEAKMASDNTFATNSLLIYSTNRISFGNVFNKYMPKALQKASHNLAGGRVIKNRATKKLDFVEHGGLLGYKTFINEAKYAASNLKKMPLQTAKFLGKYTRANVGEGMQEYFQEVIQDAEYNMAYDRYTGALSGGAWYNALSNDQYIKAYKESMQKYISSEGAEIFASGFIMGGFAGPFAYAQQNAVKHLTKTGSYIIDKQGYQADKSEEEKARTELEKNIAKFNEMTDSRKSFLYDYIEQLRTQAAIKKEIEFNADNKKDVIDLKDVALVQQLMFADNMGAYDLIIDKIKDMSNLSEDELREAFGEQIDEDSKFITNFRDSYQKIIDRAEKIKEMMDNYDKLFPEPPLYGAEDSDFETGIQEQDIRKARYYTKLLAITNQQSLVRTMERMSSIMNNVYEKAPFWNKDKTPPSSEITKIFNYNELSQEMNLLKEEIKNLKGFKSLNPDQRKDLAYKEKIYSILEKFSGNEGVLSNYLKGLKNQQIVDILKKQAEQSAELEVGKSIIYKRGKSKWEGVIKGETVDKKGRPQWVIVKPDGSRSKILKTSDALLDPGKEIPTFKDTYTEPLRKIFREYLTAVGDRYNNKVDETNFDSVFQDFKDFYALSEDEKNLSETVSFLMNPEGHYMFVERYNEMVKNRRVNMEDEVKRQLEMYQESKEENDLIQMLAKEYNLYIEADDLESLFKDNIVPINFYNIDTNAKLKTDSKTYEEVTSAVNNWLKNTNRIEEEVEESDKETEQKTSEETTKEDLKEITTDTPLEEYPDELIQLMEASMVAYNKGIDERENLSKVAKENAKVKSLADFLDNPGAKARIRNVLDKWNSKITPKSSETVKENSKSANAVHKASGFDTLETQKADIERRLGVKLPPKNTAIPVSPKTWGDRKSLANQISSELKGVVERGVSMQEWLDKGYGRQLATWSNETIIEFLEVAVIERRRQEELKNSKIEVPRYFTFGELGGKKGKKAGETVESEKNAEIQDTFERQLQEGDKLIEPNGDVFYFRNGEVVKANGQPRGFTNIGAFSQGVTIDRTDKINAKYDAELDALEGTTTASDKVVQTPSDIEVQTADIERRLGVKLPPKNTAIPVSPKTWGDRKSLANQISSELKGVVERGVSMQEWLDKGYGKQLATWSDETIIEFLEVAEIERRRQESNKNQLNEIGSNRFLKLNKEGENTELSEVELKLINSLIDRMISQGKSAKEINVELISRGFIQSQATTPAQIETYLQSRIDGKINAKVGESISQEINAKYDAELAELNNQINTQQKPVQKPIDETIIDENQTVEKDLIDPTAEYERDVLPVVNTIFPDEIKNLLLDKEIRILMVGETDSLTKQIIKALQESKRLRQNQGIKDITIGTQFIIPINTKDGIKELVFSYSGFTDIHGAGGQHKMIMDMKLQPNKTNAFPYPVEIGKDTYYASSENHKAWLEGSGKLHKFSFLTIQTTDVSSKEEINIEWTKEIYNRFKESTNLEDTLEELQTENVKREVEGEVYLDQEDLYLIYESFVEKFKGELTLEKLNLQDEYNVKGKLRKFGTAKISKKYPNGVDFISTGKKTLGQVQFIKTSELANVIQNKITTDMDETIAKQGLEEVTENDKELLKDSIDNREPLSKSKMDELAAKASTMTASERIQYLKNNRKKRCN